MLSYAMRISAAPTENQPEQKGWSARVIGSNLRYAQRAVVIPMQSLIMDELTEEDVVVKQEEGLVNQAFQQTAAEQTLRPTADQMRLLVRNVTRGAEPLSVRRLTAILANDNGCRNPS